MGSNFCNGGTYGGWAASFVNPFPGKDPSSSFPNCSPYDEVGSHAWGGCFRPGFLDTGRPVGSVRASWGTEGRDKVTIPSIADGTSNTFLIGETLTGRWAGGAWFYGFTNLATCAIPPNYFTNPRTGLPPPIGSIRACDNCNWKSDNMGFRSRHSGSLQFANADGSVRSISQTIALPVYYALASRNGGSLASLPPTNTYANPAEVNPSNF
jgi:hypothetical protein